MTTRGWETRWRKFGLIYIKIHLTAFPISIDIPHGEKKAFSIGWRTLMVHRSLCETGKRMCLAHNGARFACRPGFLSLTHVFILLFLLRVVFISVPHISAPLTQMGNMFISSPFCGTYLTELAGMEGQFLWADPLLLAWDKAEHHGKCRMW